MLRFNELIENLILRTKKGNLKWEKLSQNDKDTIRTIVDGDVLDAFYASDNECRIAVFECDRWMFDKMGISATEVVLFAVESEGKWYVFDDRSYRSESDNDENAELVKVLGSIFRLYRLVKQYMQSKDEPNGVFQKYMERVLSPENGFAN